MATAPVVGVGGVIHHVPIRRIAESMVPQNKGYSIGRYLPLDPKNAGKDLVLGQQVPISELKVGKVYDIAYKDDLSTQHKEIYFTYTGTVKSVDTTDDGRTTALIALSPALIAKLPGVYDVRFRENDALFFKKRGVQYGGRRTKKQKRSRRRRTVRYR